MVAVEALRVASPGLSYGFLAVKGRCFNSVCGRQIWCQAGREAPERCQPTALTVARSAAPFLAEGDYMGTFRRSTASARGTRYEVP